MSIQTQKSMLSQYAEQNGFEETVFYVDDGFSGTSFERPDFQRMLTDIEDGKIGTVITKDLSRLGRDYLKTGFYTECYFPENHVRYIAINDNVDTAKGDNEFAPFRNIMNEWYARDVSRKIKSAYRTKAQKGEFTGPYAPYGYRKSPEDKHKLIIDEETAPIVKRIFELAASGVSPFRITTILKKDGILKPRAYTMETAGKYVSAKNVKYPYDWGNQTIIQMLRFAELDVIIKRLYEDNVLGKLTDERFMVLSREYENEQKQINESIVSLKTQVTAFSDTQESSERFAKVVQKYCDIKELDAVILNELIDKIVIHECEYVDGERTQKIDIYYNFVGLLQM